MREETKRRLERALWLRRAKWAGVGAAVVAAFALLFMVEGMDATVARTPVHGVVTKVGPLNGTSFKAAAQGLSVDVRLDSGHMVTVMALRTTNPHVGDDVNISEHRHGTGRVTYSWK